MTILWRRWQTFCQLYRDIRDWQRMMEYMRQDDNRNGRGTHHHERPGGLLVLQKMR